jgi:hypothetical protein
MKIVFHNLGKTFFWKWQIKLALADYLTKTFQPNSIKMWDAIL